jgi:hypothetical protein
LITDALYNHGNNNYNYNVGDNNYNYTSRSDQGRRYNNNYDQNGSNTYPGTANGREREGGKGGFADALLLDFGMKSDNGGGVNRGTGTAGMMTSNGYPQSEHKSSTPAQAQRQGQAHASASPSASATIANAPPPPPRTQQYLGGLSDRHQRALADQELNTAKQVIETVRGQLSRSSQTRQETKRHIDEEKDFIQAIQNGNKRDGYPFDIR